MTLLYSDPQFLEHATGAHPESPRRLIAITRHFEATGLDQRCTRPEFAPISRERLARVHDPRYIAEVAEFVGRGGGQIEIGTGGGPQSFDVGLFAAREVVHAV